MNEQLDDLIKDESLREAVGNEAYQKANVELQHLFVRKDKILIKVVPLVALLLIVTTVLIVIKVHPFLIAVIFVALIGMIMIPLGIQNKRKIQSLKRAGAYSPQRIITQEGVSYLDIKESSLIFFKGSQQDLISFADIVRIVYLARSDKTVVRTPQAPGITNRYYLVFSKNGVKVFMDDANQVKLLDTDVVKRIGEDKYALIETEKTGLITLERH